MPVYVDQPLTNPTDTRIAACFSGRQSCHMYADTLEELHHMAQEIGLRREWFQDKQQLQHYDLTMGKRAQAVGRGAVQQNRMEAVAKWRELRAKRNKEKERVERDEREGTLW